METCFSGSVSFLLALASFFFRLTVFDLWFSVFSFLAVSSLSRSFRDGVLFRLLTVGVLSTFIYRRTGQLSQHTCVA